MEQIAGSRSDLRGSRTSLQISGSRSDIRGSRTSLQVSGSRSDLSGSRTSLRPDSISFHGSTQSLQMASTSPRVSPSQNEPSSPYLLRKVPREYPSSTELSVEWDGSQASLRNEGLSLHGSSQSLHISSASPRLSPISNDSSSPYLLRKVSADKDKHHVRPGAPSEPNEYNFNYRRRGVFLIFNNKHFLESTGQLEREGTDVDAERLEERFQDTGFEVRRYDDVTYARMTKLMQDIASSDHSECDCFGCAVLSHGREGYVYATDKLVPLEMLTLPFKGDKCPTLVGKPKLFFIQACTDRRTTSFGEHKRASPSRFGINGAPSPHIASRRVPVEADFLFSYSTVPGYYSWRNNQDGTWYIQALCIVIENYGNKMELMQMLTQVNRMVAYEFESCSDEEFTEDIKQTPSIVSMLTRYVYFRPKKPDIRG